MNSVADPRVRCDGCQQWRDVRETRLATVGRDLKVRICAGQESLQCLPLAVERGVNAGTMELQAGTGRGLAVGESETSFQDRVVALAKAAGWTLYHPYDSRKSAPGWPDLVLMRGREVLFRELKTDSGRTTAEQREWLDGLEAAGQDVEVWRPRDWDRIAQRLGSAYQYQPVWLLAQGIAAMVEAGDQPSPHLLRDWRAARRALEGQVRR
jgi:VRR-NUC domain